jgi:hypothetical protein
MSLSNTERLRVAESSVARLESDLGTFRTVLQTAGDVAETVDGAREVAERATGRLRRLLPWVLSGLVVAAVIVIVRQRAAGSAVAEEPSQDLPAG